MKKVYLIPIVLLALILVGGLFALITWVGVLLWNAILPNLLGFNEIGFWQFAGLSLLIEILFGVVPKTLAKELEKANKN